MTEDGRMVKAVIMDEQTLRRSVMRMAHEILEKNRGAEDLVLVGILRRGKPLAELLQENMEKIEGVDVPCGNIDINFYRDDLSQRTPDPTLRRLDLPFSIEGKRIVLVDDVLYTGRTARAAIEALFTAGRPAGIQLAILIDRGHRELPIRADYVGKSIPTARQESVAVHLPPIDSDTGVFLMHQSEI